MAGSYDRRNFNPYFHRGGGGNPLPPSYRNKAFLIVMATAMYAAFLYHSGTYHRWHGTSLIFILGIDTTSFHSSTFIKVEQANSLTVIVTEHRR